MTGNHSQIIVIGSINTDMVVKSDTLPHPGETVLGQEFVMSGGGKGANQAVAAARLGATVAMVGCVGADMFGAQAKNSLEAEAINCQHVLESKSAASGIALISVDKGGENQIVVAPGANYDVSEEQVSAALDIADSNTLVLLQLEIPHPVVRHAIASAGEKGARVILDPAPAQSLSQEMLANVFLLTPNQTEAEQLTNIVITNMDAAEGAAESLLEKGVQNIALTMGEEGVLLGSRDGMEIIPGIKVDAIDTTAAGDCFNGALATALSEDASLTDAAKYACQAAAIAVTRLGAQDAMPVVGEMLNPVGN